MNYLFFFLAALFLLGFSAFFSGSETAFFSLSSTQLEDLKHSKDPGDRRIRRLLQNPHRLLIAILVGNTLVNTTLASITAFLTSSIFQSNHWPESIGIFLDVAIITFLILVIGEITPKVFAVNNNLPLARKASFLLQVIVFLLRPVIRVLDLVTRMISKPTQKFKNQFALSEKDFKILVEVSEQSRALQVGEQKLLRNIFDFGETVVKEIMIPRVDLVALPVQASPRQAVEAIRQERYSRIPLFESDLDHIVGILYAKDLIPYLRRLNELSSLRAIARPVYLVPETKMIDDLLQEFQKKNIHMAIVVDEFGGTAGLVTLEDILEELVGEIEEETAVSGEMIAHIPDGRYRVDPRIPIDDFNEAFHAYLKKDEDFETLGGYLLYRLGRLPREQEGVRSGRFLFRVTRIEGTRILEVQLEIRKPRKASVGANQITE